VADARRRHTLGAIGPCQVVAVERVARDAREAAAALAHVEEVRIRELARRLAGRALPDLDQPLRVAVGQGPQQRRLDGREDRRVRADAERQRDDRDRGEAAVAQERPQRVAHVLPQAFHRASLHVTLRLEPGV
jgi:hypothetical protein